MSQHFLESDIFPYLKRSSVQTKNLLIWAVPYEPLRDIVVETTIVGRIIS